MSFKDILAQPFAVETLKKALQGERLSGTTLFLGPEGVGKRFTARQLAKAIHCETLKGDSCDACLSCRKIEGALHPDLLWIEPSRGSELSIEAIRELKKKIILRPWEGKKRLAVIVQAERATEEAQNAFLKMLEETPSSSLILLTSVRSEGILPTVLSRCKVIRFGPIPTETIQDVLKERAHLSVEDASALAKLCHGNLGKALSLKEGLLEQKSEIVNHFLERALQVDEEKAYFEDKEKILHALDLLISWYRDIWVAREGLSSKFLFHETDSVTVHKESSRWKGEAIEEALSELLSARESLEQHVNPKLLLTLLSRKLRALKASSV